MADKDDRSTIFCPAHPDAHLIDDHRAGDVVCSECGLVVGDRVIDVSAEWRTFSKELNDKGPGKCRVGSTGSQLLPESNISLFTKISENSNYHEYRDQKESRMLTAFNTMTLLAERLNLDTAILKRGQHVLCQLVTKGNPKRLTESRISACLYIACREEATPRSFKEICAVSHSSVKEIGHSYKSIVRLLGSNVDVVESKDYISRYCGWLSVPSPIQRIATHIAHAAKELGIAANRSPLAIAATAIYLALLAFDEKRSLKVLASVVGVSESTIRRVYATLLPRAIDLFPADFTFIRPVSKFADCLN